MDRKEQEENERVALDSLPGDLRRGIPGCLVALVAIGLMAVGAHAVVRYFVG